MARRLDPALVISGYFWTTEFSQITPYVIEYLRQYTHPIRFVIHASAVFYHNESDAEEATEREIHMAACDPAMFDPWSDPHYIENQIGLNYDEMHEPDNWTGLDGSGWTIIPGSFTYWFKIMPFQPNNSAQETTKNVREPMDIEDPPDPDTSSQLRPVEVIPNYDSFFIALANHYNSNHNRLNRRRYHNKLCSWLMRSQIYPDTYSGKITPGNVAAVHEQIGRYTIRVWSEYGNIIYYREMNDSDTIIDMLWKYRKFKYITNLWSLLNEKKDRILCSVCKKFHRSDFNCKEHVVASSHSTVQVPEFPEGRHNLVCYADFESIVKLDNNHECSGFAFIFVEGNDGMKIQDMTLNYDENPNLIFEFLEYLYVGSVDYAFGELSHQGISEEAIAVGVGVAVAQVTKMVAKRFRRTWVCPICENEVGDYERYVMGRNFINGGYGKHHKSCWEDTKNCLIVYFHNFRGYDSNYVLNELMKENEWETDFISGKSFEKFDVIAISRQHPKGLIRIAFKDTFNYLATSLAKLVEQVTDFKYTPIRDQQHKGTFPYRWFNDHNKLKNLSLPPTDEWYNDITQVNVDPAPAIKLWEREKFETFAEFHDYYMRTDVYHLADIFEEFRRTSLEATNLDPAYFQGAPGYTWHLNLKMNAENMYIIPDTDVYVDIQKNIRGGVSQVMHRYVNIENDPSKTLLYLDVNSLYSKCMTLQLPTEYLGKLEYLPENWQSLYTGDVKQTAFICVDLVYPEYLHDSHVAYPLAPHKFNGRLCTTFERKEKYLTHAENLKFYLDHGMLIEQFHYMYVFKQDYILKSYVDGNIDKRRETSRPALKTLYKLLNNSLYGKTCENKFKYRKFQIHENERGIFGKINSYLIDAVNWLPIEDRVLVEHRISKIVADKPIQIGMAVLDLSKLQMYNFLFKVQEVFKGDVIPVYTDTDSLLLLFNHPNPQNVLFEHPLTKGLLDFDKVPEHWTVHTPGTLKQSGLWSLETTEKIIEFVGIRAKTYCYRTLSDKTVLKNKGITATAVELHTRKKLTMEHYKMALFQDKEIKVHQTTIGSTKHKLKNKPMIKLALSNNDEKRMILPDKITTIPFGYKGDKYSEYISVEE